MRLSGPRQVFGACIATAGEDGVWRGGGIGKSSGSGHAGEVWITVPHRRKGGRSCCACDIDRLHFPDSLVVNVTVADVDPQCGWSEAWDAPAVSGLDCEEVPCPLPAGPCYEEVVTGCEDPFGCFEEVPCSPDPGPCNEFVPWCPFGGDVDGDAANGCCPAVLPVYGDDACHESNECSQFGPDPPQGFDPIASGLTLACVRSLTEND